MEKTQITGLISYIIDSSPPEKKGKISEILADEFYKEDGLHYVISQPGKKGGYVGLASDLISLSDAWLVIETVQDDLSPISTAQLLIRLVKLIKDYKDVSEFIDENQLIVMLAIKKGNSSIEDIARKTNLSITEVKEIISSLSKKRYKKEIPLVDILDDNQIITRF